MNDGYRLPLRPKSTERRFNCVLRCRDFAAWNSNNKVEALWFQKKHLGGFIDIANSLDLSKVVVDESLGARGATSKRAARNL